MSIRRVLKTSVLKAKAIRSHESFDREWLSYQKGETIVIVQRKLTSSYKYIYEGALGLNSGQFTDEDFELFQDSNDESILLQSIMQKEREREYYYASICNRFEAFSNETEYVWQVVQFLTRNKQFSQFFNDGLKSLYDFVAFSRFYFRRLRPFQENLDDELGIILGTNLTQQKLVAYNLIKNLLHYLFACDNSCPRQNRLKTLALNAESASSYTNDENLVEILLYRVLSWLKKWIKMQQRTHEDLTSLLVHIELYSETRILISRLSQDFYEFLTALNYLISNRAPCLLSDEDYVVLDEVKDFRVTHQRFSDLMNNEEPFFLSSALYINPFKSSPDRNVLICVSKHKFFIFFEHYSMPGTSFSSFGESETFVYDGIEYELDSQINIQLSTSNGSVNLARKYHGVDLFAIRIENINLTRVYSNEPAFGLKLFNEYLVIDVFNTNEATLKFAHASIAAGLLNTIAEVTELNSFELKSDFAHHIMSIASNNEWSYSLPLNKADYERHFGAALDSFLEEDVLAYPEQDLNASSSELQLIPQQSAALLCKESGGVEIATSSLSSAKCLIIDMMSMSMSMLFTHNERRLLSLRPPRSWPGSKLGSPKKTTHPTFSISIAKLNDYIISSADPTPLIINQADENNNNNNNMQLSLFTGSFKQLDFTQKEFKGEESFAEMMDVDLESTIDATATAAAAANNSEPMDSNSNPNFDLDTQETQITDSLLELLPSVVQIEDAEHIIAEPPRLNSQDLVIHEEIKMFSRDIGDRLDKIELQLSQNTQNTLINRPSEIRTPLPTPDIDALNSQSFGLYKTRPKLGESVVSQRRHTIELQRKEFSNLDELLDEASGVIKRSPKKKRTIELFQMEPGVIIKPSEAIHQPSFLFNREDDQLSPPPLPLPPRRRSSTCRLFKSPPTESNDLDLNPDDDGIDEAEILETSKGKFVVMDESQTVVLNVVKFNVRKIIPLIDESAIASSTLLNTPNAENQSECETNAPNTSFNLDLEQETQITDSLLELLPNVVQIKDVNAEHIIVEPRLRSPSYSRLTTPRQSCFNTPQTERREQRERRLSSMSPSPNSSPRTTTPRGSSRITTFPGQLTPKFARRRLFKDDNEMEIGFDDDEMRNAPIQHETFAQQQQNTDTNAESNLNTPKTFKVLKDYWEKLLSKK